jgi:hypothetical protein
MGYYTDYDLEIIGGAQTEVKGTDSEGKPASVFVPLDPSHITDEVLALSGYSSFSEIKWYDHEVHMRQISQKYKDLLFVLSGKGEDSSDLWVKYFKNGKMQTARARIEYDEFDEKKLS